MKKNYIILFLLLFICVHANAQLDIFGPQVVCPGTVWEYETDYS